MIVAGTGHRPSKLGGYSETAQNALFRIAFGWLCDNKPDVVISGMALGWDMELASAACILGVPYIAAIPFKGQELKWPEKSQTLYNNLLGRAVDVVVVCEGGYESWKMQKRNEWMVDHADMMLALWDGTTGGTYNCLKYAKKKGKPITNLYDQWKLKL